MRYSLRSCQVDGLGIMTEQVDRRRAIQRQMLVLYTSIRGQGPAEDEAQRHGSGGDLRQDVSKLHHIEEVEGLGEAEYS